MLPIGRALREKSACREYVLPLSARRSQLVEREANGAPKKVRSRRVSIREDAAAVPGKEGIIELFDPRLRLQHFSLLVPVDGAEACVNCFHGVTSVSQVVVKYTAIFKPDSRAAGVR